MKTNQSSALLSAILDNYKDVILCYTKLSEDNLHSRFVFLKDDFTSLDIMGVNCPDDLVTHLDKKSETCEVEGYAQYGSKLIKLLSLKSLPLGGKSLYVPLIHNDTRVFLMLKVIDVPSENIRAFLFSNMDQNSLQLENLLFDSYKDPLTGLFNFNTFKLHIQKNIHDLYLGLFDLNKFKGINDKYGHEAGDKVLKQIGDLLVSFSSPNEIYYHRSGDEFIFLSFRMDKDYINSLVQKMTEGLKSIKIGDDEITASFGLAEIRHDNRKKCKGVYDDLFTLQLADIAMYRAKAEHKPTVIFSKDDVDMLMSQGDLSEMVSSLIAAHKR